VSTEPTARSSGADLYVSPDGDDEWSGTEPDPRNGGPDGPFETIRRAQLAVRDRKREATFEEPVTVWLRGGRYDLEAPLEFTPADSAPVVYRAYHGERPVISGGRRVTDWEQTEVDGVDAWVTDLPAVADDEWYFHSLYVDGQRRPRPRLPKSPDEFYQIQGVPGIDRQAWFDEESDFIYWAPEERGQDTFEFAPGDVREWRNVTDVEAVVLHYWLEERMPIETVDTERCRVTTTRGSAYSLIDDAAKTFPPYYVENVFEALSEPGEWYLDRSEGRLYYLPKEGEDPETTEVVAPWLSRLLAVEGRPGDGEFVEFVRFRDLAFRFTDSPFPEDATVAGASQAGHVPGVISLTGARNCAIADCTVGQVGWHAIAVDEGCRGLRIVGNEMTDLGAGGVTVRGAGVDAPLDRRTGRLRVCDNEIRNGGRVFHGAGGISATNTFDSDLSHNRVCDFYYNGISCNGGFAYRDSVARDNRIEYNHVYDVGQGLLSDMGGIYVNGVQPGTVVRGNHVHDVEKRNYGGWAVYLDGAAHVLVEGNVCHDTNSQLFNQHYGRENAVRHNVFAFGDAGLVSLLRAEGQQRSRDWAERHGRIDRDGETADPRVAFTRDKGGRSFVLHRNVLLTDGTPMIVGHPGPYGGDVADRDVDSDLNVLWDVSAGEAPDPAGGDGSYDGGNWSWERTFSLAELRERGYDRRSTVADPAMADPEAMEFGFGADSPAADLGIEPAELSAVGPRTGDR